MAWKLASSLVMLRDQINATWPKRSQLSDGTIGDVNHSSKKSDHNPTPSGLVCAFDITNDPNNGCDAGKLAEALRLSRDPRIKYVIWNKRMFSSYKTNAVSAWSWRPYSGENPHTKHVHVSVVATEPAWKIV